MLVQLDTPENADRNLKAAPIAVLTITPDALFPMECKAYIKFGDGAKNLDGTGGDFLITVTVGGQTIQPAAQAITFSTAVRAAIFSESFIVPAGEEVVVLVLSPNVADTDVDVTAILYDVSDTWTDKNDRFAVKDTGVWYIDIYEPDGTTKILRKAWKDKNGNAVTDIEAGTLARELRSSV